MATEKKFLSLNYKGELTEYSKEAKEGFVKKESSTGKVGYYKFYDKGVEGKLSSVSERTNEKINNRKEISISVYDDKNNITYYISTEVKSQYAPFTTMAESIIKQLPALKLDYVYNFSPYYIEKEWKNDTKSGINKYAGLSISFLGEKVEKVSMEGVDKYEFCDVDEKNVISKAYKLFFKNLLKDNCERLAWKGNAEADKSEVQPFSEATPEDYDLLF